MYILVCFIRNYYIGLLANNATVNVTETFTDILKHYFLQMNFVKFAKCML